ncbi:MAG: glycosyltransferase family 39 protein, partial [Candidatus Didemnitutus sp.]|nr:glycosyltransferase family 39 protein [Candidatus Didemnitutus sp.]
MSRLRSGACLGFALLLLTSAWLLRSPGLEKKFWNVDEAVTFTMAQQILAGDVPYRDAVDQRNPLAPYAQALVFSLAGDWNFHAQHTAIALLLGLTAVLLWLMARRWGDGATGVAAALWFTLLSFMLPTVRDAMPAHTAWYLVFFSTLGFWALAAAWTSGGTGWAVLSGAAFGLSLLSKQPGVLDFGVALVLVALGTWFRPTDRAKLRRLLLALLGGFSAPVFVTVAYFGFQGAWPDLVYYAWTYNNTLYVPEVPLLERWQTIQVPFILAWGYHPLAVVFGTVAGVALLRRVLTQAVRQPKQFDLPGWLILGWCAAGLISTTLSGRGFSHYSIQLIPGLSLACGWVTAGLLEMGWRWAGSSKIRRGLLLMAAIAGVGWLLQPLPERLRSLDLPDPGSDVVTQLVRRHTGTNDRIFVWGYTPEIYTLSERLPATRFLYCTFLTGLIPWTNLDPLRNTDYAVVPGAWDDFLADWKKHPPLLVADGRTQRGFLKYPLEKQPLLWPLIERDYAEIEIPMAESVGFWLFRKLERVEPRALPDNLEPSDKVQLHVRATSTGQTARVRVEAPAETRWLDLYLDGALYRRLAWPADGSVAAAFFILAADRPGSIHRVQAIAVTSETSIASLEAALTAMALAPITGGPPLVFNGQNLSALESSTITGKPIRQKAEAPEHWDAHAPSRLVYPWLPGMNSLAFSFGIEQLALAREPPNGTDGVEVVVQVEDQSGQIIQVYRHYLDWELARRAQGRVVDSTPLPPGGPGKIILQMTPGPRSDPAFDWSYWLWVRADPSPLALMTRSGARYPARLESGGKLRQTEFNGRLVTVMSAPTLIEFAVTPELSEFSGGFGLLDTAWLGKEKTGPVNFAITLVKPDGTEVSILKRQLDPVRRAEDRGFRAFHLSLPQPLVGR